jgi:signal transduction histidine kinase
VRLVTIRKELPDDRAIYVQGAAGMARLEQTIRTVRSLLFTVVFVSLVIAGITSWHMARRSLQPVADIVRQVRELTSDRLDRRIPVPHGNDEIAEMVRVVNEMLDRLGREFANQQRFISSVSHELKTPLAVLLGEAQAARRLGRDATDLDEFVGMVQQEAGRLVRIVDAFLILTRATSGAGPAVKVRTAIEDVVFEAVKRVQVLADEHGVRVVPTLDLPDDGPEAVVAGDVDLLCSMVENLVRNAIRHNPSGSDVSVAVTVDDSHAHIAVSDCGLGIPVAQLPHIFDLFQPASSDGRRAGKLGIGLSIAQSVARLHGGTITAVNREEGGCEFLVELPLATADSAAD